MIGHHEHSSKPILKFTSWLYLLIVLLVPGRYGTWLDGVPLNQPAEWWVFVILLLNFALYVLIRFDAVVQPSPRILSLAEKFGVQPVFNKFNEHHFKLFCILLLTKLFLFQSNTAIPAPFFSFCYHPLTSKLAAGCYQSTDNLFRLNGATYLSRELTWNSKGDYENWYRNDTRYLLGGPFEVRITGWIASGSNVRVRYQGNLRGQLGGQSFDIFSAEINEKTISLPKGAQPVEFTLSGEKAYLEVLGERNGVWHRIKATSASGSELRRQITQVIAWVLCAVLLMWGLLFLTQLLLYLPIRWSLTLPLVFGYGLRHISWEWGFPLLVLSCYGLALLEKEREGRIHYLSWLMVILFSVSINFQLPSHLDTLQIRSPEDDPLTYETLGRKVIWNQSLEGGEDVFFYQPGFRYYLAVILSIFGEYNAMPLVLNVSAFLGALWLVFVWLDNRAQPTLLSRFSAIVALAVLAKLGANNVLFNLTEFLAWVLLMVALMAGFSKSAWDGSKGLRTRPEGLPRGSLFLFSICLALAVVVRPNQILGACILFGILFLSYAANHFQKKTVRNNLIISASLFVLTVSLPLLHNLYYGQKAVLFSQGSTQSATYVFPPKRLLELHLPEVQQKLKHQLSHLLVLRPALVIRMNRISALALNLILGLFVLGLFFAIRRKELGLALAATLTVAGFSIVHVFYQVDNYYPRHIIAIYLVMAIFSTILLAKPKGTSV